MKAYRIKSALVNSYCEVREVEIKRFSRDLVHFADGRTEQIEKGCNETMVQYLSSREEAYNKAIEIATRSIELARSNLKKAESNHRLLIETRDDGSDYFLKVARQDLE